MTEEQKAKARACNSTDELVTLAKAEGHELSDEELNSVSGGAWGACDAHACGGNDSCWMF